MQTQQAAQTLQQIAEIRRATRGKLKSLWFPLVLWGSLTLGSLVAVAAFADGVPGAGLGLYWAIAGPAGGVATGSYYQRREQRLGLQSAPTPYVLTGIGIFLGAFAAGAGGAALGSKMLSALGPLLVVSAGWLVFAWLDRSSVVAALALGLAAAAVAVWESGMQASDAALVGSLLYGGSFIAVGLCYLSVEKLRQ